MEQRLGGTCVFVVGSIGGLMTPLGLKLTAPDGREIPKDSFELARAVGERAADAALEALKAGRPSASRRSSTGAPRSSCPSRTACSASPPSWACSTARSTAAASRATALFGDDLMTEIGYLRLGDAEVLLVPAEIYPELVLGGIQDPQDPGADFPGAPRERALFTLLRSEYKLVFGLANDEIGYVIPRSQWDAKTPFAYGRAKTSTARSTPSARPRRRASPRPSSGCSRG